MAILVVADTHFGVKKSDLNLSMPGPFSAFLEWIVTLEKKGKIPVKILEGSLEEGKITTRPMQKPDKIIFLGDIIELWDSENEPVTSCLSTVIPTLSQVKAEKVYVLGNHDDILRRIVLKKGKKLEYLHYLLGGSALTIVPDTYPPFTREDGKYRVQTEKCGNQEYLFVHGHQFSPFFVGGDSSNRLLCVLRDTADNLTYFVPGLFVAALCVWGLNKVAHTSIFLGENPTLGLLFLLTIPAIYVKIGRRIWNWIVGVKYQKQKTIDDFTKWWEHLIRTYEPPKKGEGAPSWENINVVYGHTHFLNFIPSPPQERTRGRAGVHAGSMYQTYEKLMKERTVREEAMPTMANISAWVTDFPSFSERVSAALRRFLAAVLSRVKDEAERNRLDPELVTVGTFLYIDEEGFEFLGWNWYQTSGSPVFHIPKPAIERRMDVGPVTDNEKVRKTVKALGWPPELIDIWKRDPYVH